MGGSSKSTTVGHKYRVGMHVGLIAGVIGKIFKVEFADKTAWTGNATDSIYIDAPDLFGGTSSEGGVVGTIDICRGLPDQGQNSYLASVLGSDLLPAFRKFTCAVWRQIYFGTNPYPKDVTYWGERVDIDEDGNTQWYAEKAAIGAYNTDGTDPLDASLALNDLVPYGSHWFYLAVAQSDESLYLGNLPNYGIAPFADALPHPFLGGDPDGAWTQVDEITTFWATTLVAVTDSRPVKIVVKGDNERTLWIDGVEQSPTGVSTWTTTYTYTPAEKSFRVTVRVTEVETVPSEDNYKFFDAYLYQDAVEDIGPYVWGDYSDMNPSHMIREWYTCKLWGRGYASADMGNSFIAAADTLYDEGFGLSFLWSGTDTAEDRIKEICRHIDAKTYLDPSTGLYEIKLIRDDYIVADLLLLDESNIIEVTDYKQQTVSDCFNEVCIKYQDAVTGEDASFTATDIALVQTMGGPVPTTVSYPGIANATVAEKVAWRDLRSLGTPTLSARLSCKRVAAQLRNGDAFRFSWPKYGISEMVMRVTDINYGSSTSSAVTVTCTQDVFSIPATLALGSGAKASAWVPDDPTAKACDHRISYELPYMELVQRQGQAIVDATLAATPEAGWAGISAVTPTASSIRANIYTDSGAGYVEYGSADFCPAATLSAGVDKMDTVWTISALADMAEVELGTWAQIDDELVGVVAVDLVAGTMTVTRSVLDSVPAKHTAGAIIYFWDVYSASDEVQYIESESINMKLQTVTSSSSLNIAMAPIDTVLIEGRAARPYPPANVKINDEYYPESLLEVAEFAFTWAHRDRTQQTGSTLIGWTEGNIGPETGVTYSLEISRTDTNAVLETVTGITGAATTVGLSYNGEIKAELWSVRDGLESWKRFSHVFLISPFTVVDDTAVCYTTTTASGNVLTNDTGTPIFVSAVSGVEANVGVGVAGSAGGTFTIAADGTWTFVPGSDFDAINGTSSTASTSIGITVSNGSQTKTETLTVNLSADERWADVVSLINASGAEGSTTITDAKGLVVTVVGDTHIDTSLGYPVIKLDGSGDSYNVPNSTATKIEAGLWTFDAIVTIDRINVRQGIMGNRSDSGSTGCIFHIQSDNTLNLFMTGGNSITSTNKITTGTHHIEASIDASRVARIFVDGVLWASGTIAAGTASTSPLYFGREDNSSCYLQGKIRCQRLTRGTTVRHTAAFTPPIGPFPTA